MKIRNGFVSNSSSSSFILDGNKYTCVDVAIDMVKTMYESWKEWDDEDHTETVKLYTERLEKLENKNIGIFFNTSDDLEIAKINDKIYVSASNHIEWGLDYIGYGEEDEYYEKYKDTEWYLPQIDNQHIGKIVDDEEDWVQKKYGEKWIYRCDNEKCSERSRYLVKENIVFCPNCMTDPNGNKVSFRKEKFKRLLDNENL